MVSRFCLGCVLFVSWWYLGGTLVASRLCPGFVSVVSWWYVVSWLCLVCLGGISVVSWWYFCGISVV